MMTNGVGGGYGAASMMQMQRPDPSQMASKLFAKLDTKNQGYIEQSDLQAAFNAPPGTSAASTDMSTMFSKIDGNGDGKVTEDEFSEKLKQITEQLDGQFNAMRMNSGTAAGAGGLLSMLAPGQEAASDPHAAKLNILQLLREYGNGETSADDTRTRNPAETVSVTV